jgi:hypothetical protein
MHSYAGWCRSADHLIDHVSQSSQSFSWHHNARSYNGLHRRWLFACHQIVDVIPGMSEREYCNGAGHLNVERADCKRLWDIVWVDYRWLGLRFRLAWHDRISFVDATCALWDFPRPTSPGRALHCAGLFRFKGQSSHTMLEGRQNSSARRPVSSGLGMRQAGLKDLARNASVIRDGDFWSGGGSGPLSSSQPA